MEKIATATQKTTISNYVALAKPGIIMGNAFTASAGLVLASKGHISFGLFFAALMGLSLIIGSACAFNNCIDCDSDKLMYRTRRRPLALGSISTKHAIIFAIATGLLGALILTLFTNALTLSIALFGFFVYVILYSYLKYRTPTATLIGSFAGAAPPLAGYCAVNGCIEPEGLIFFLMIVLWQMPHFFAIAIYRLDDYAKASIPVLPLKKGLLVTKIHMLFYTMAFVIVSALLTLFNYTGYLYLIAVLSLGIAWVGLCMKGFTCANEQKWARQMFIFSLIVVMGICFIIPFSISH